MRRTFVQRYTATLADGSVVDVCCGPALSKLDELVSYRRVGDPTLGTCCHIVSVSATEEVLQAIDETLLAEWFEANAWRAA